MPHNKDLKLRCHRSNFCEFLWLRNFCSFICSKNISCPNRYDECSVLFLCCNLKQVASHITFLSSMLVYVETIILKFIFLNFLIYRASWESDTGLPITIIWVGGICRLEGGWEQILDKPALWFERKESLSLHLFLRKWMCLIQWGCSSFE